MMDIAIWLMIIIVSIATALVIAISWKERDK